jgi:tetratricopeptide (TPR) repeat protein
MPDVARNAPCPCGSNRRYKDCHGAIGSASPARFAAPAAAAAQPAPSTYRPSGVDWADLGRTEQEECGAMMERALGHQRAERFDEAAEAYTAVLAKAPRTHDALHMLGAIKLRRGELREARRLVEAAMRLRPAYAAIEHNLQLISDAERASNRLSLQRSPSVELCEAALPILVDLVLRAGDPEAAPQPSRPTGSPDAASTVHLIRGAQAGDVDPGWLVRRLAALLSPADLQLWATDNTRDAGIVGSSVRRIDAALALVPRGGCHVFVGIDVDCAEWVRQADAERVVVFCQPASPAKFLDQLRAIAWDGARRIDLVFPSQAMATRFGTGHAVLPPPVELRDNPPALNRAKGSARARLAGLRVGVVSGNGCSEPPADEAKFLKDVVASAGTLALYDAGLLRFSLGGEAAVSFHARRENGLEPFLDTLDCLLVCPQPWWREADGRELFTAMASGVPVLCPAASIYAEYIADGVDGFLYRSPEEATQQLVDLRRAPTRVPGLGWAARAKAAKLVDAAAMASTVRQWVTGDSAGAEPGGTESPRLRTITS